MLNNKQHPVYGGLLIENKQELNEFFEEFKKQKNSWVILPEFISTTTRYWITMCFVDLNRELILCRKKPQVKQKIIPIPYEDVSEQQAQRTEVIIASLRETGFDPKPNAHGDFDQVAGPMRIKKTFLDGGEGSVAKFLYVITDFDGVLKKQDQFLWVPVSLMGEIFQKNNFFDHERFREDLVEVLQQKTTIEKM